MYGRSDKPIGCKDRDGYLQISTRRPDGGYGGMCHRVIWEHVHGPIPEGMQINHKNGIKHDNRICNLEVVTPSENIRHAFRTGLSSAVGDRSHRKVLTSRLVMAARKRAAKGERCKSIAADFGVHVETLRNAIKGTTWGHLPLIRREIHR